MERQQERPVNCVKESCDTYNTPCQDAKFVVLASRKFKIQFRKMCYNQPIFF